MADSLFDNRYRYDFIYPRGRSGETLRAVDTKENERPVVIKRPGPNDAPPIRAGQEVSIMNERKALSRLAGHPVATSLLGDGQFLVGGTLHQYIVMERAEGIIIAEQVHELAAQQGARLPELEMLVIVDLLLDLLQTAHQKDVVYNDVDAKHLFWDRENYRLKVIDWGNAVFLEGDEVTPQGISRQSDVYQVGELLYFILTGGRRVEIPRDAGDDFKLDFGEDNERIHSRLQEIVTRAVHPNTKNRYASIAALRRDLTAYRTPIDKDRGAVVDRILQRLRQERLSKTELQTLLSTLEPALVNDPGYPQAREAQAELIGRLRDLNVAADLDAVRIYMESGNWSRSADLLTELREKTGSKTSGLVRLMLDICLLMMETNQTPTAAVMDTVTLIFEDQIRQAAQRLLTTPAPDAASWTLQWRVAERISSNIPDVLLLRPNLYRMQMALAQLEQEGIYVDEPLAVLSEIDAELEKISSVNAANLRLLRDSYRSVVDHLNTLGRLLPTLSAQHNLSNRRLSLNSLDRALLSAMAMADNMHVIGKQATSSPRDAMGALDNSRAIDPSNPVWDAIERMLNQLYERLQSCQTYVPAADGSDLEQWLSDTVSALNPFVERLFDELLSSMTGGLDTARKAWTDYDEDVIAGNRAAAIDNLTLAADSVTTISPTLSGWFNQVRSVVTNARYVQRNAVYGGLGRALADGWEAFDRGRMSAAERLGQQALEISRNDSHRLAARRLQILSQVMREWIERNVVMNPRRTQEILDTIHGLMTREEHQTIDDFVSQMPSTEIYLRAMGKGLIEVYSRQSTSMLRMLFATYILSGTLDAHDGKLDDATFWREAANRALGDYGVRHPATSLLDEFITRRRDVLAAAEILNKVDGAGALPKLDSMRRQLEENAESRLLDAGIYSLRELESALRDWSDGEFRAAGLKIENALHAVNKVEQTAGITLTAYRGWLMRIQSVAAESFTRDRLLRGIVENRETEVNPEVGRLHHLQVDVTEELLGEAYAPTLRQWRDTYDAFVAVYTDSSIRRSKRLERLNELFRAMFIDRHPGYALYRHWHDVTEQSPEFPAPPTDEPVPRISEGPVDDTGYTGSKYSDVIEPEVSGGGIPRSILLGGLGILAVIVVAVIAVAGGNLNDTAPTIDLTITNTPEGTNTPVGQAVAVSSEVGSATEVPSGTPESEATEFLTPTRVVTSESTSVVQLDVTATPEDTDTPEPTSTPTHTHTPTHTDTPTHTYTPTITLTPSNTPTITPTPTATLPPNGLRGTQNLLSLVEALATPLWSQEIFAPGHDGTYWRLGVGNVTEGDEIRISPPAELLETYYGNNAASRILRIEANMMLRSQNPAILDEDDLYFGILLQSNEDGNNVGLRVQIVQPTVMNILQISNNETSFLAQRSISAPIARLRIDRAVDTDTVTLFLNDNIIGRPIRFVDPDAQILPVLFVKDGGVVIGVTEWRITLR